MSLPKTVRIDHIDNTIKACTQKEIDKEMNDQGPTGHFGGYYSNRESVVAVLTENRHSAQVARTLLHEILHGCMIGSPVDFKTEEAIVTLLEGRLAGVIKDNPKVIKYLVETL